MPHRNVLPTAVEQTVVVIPPIARIEISPRGPIVRVGDTVRVVVRAFDRDGTVIPGVPIQLDVSSKPVTHRYRADQPVAVSWGNAGQYLMTAAFGAHTDTARVSVGETR